MSRVLAWGVVCAQVLFLDPMGAAQAAGLGFASCGRYVSPSGADSSECTHPSAPCLTIAHAVSAAAPGDTIFVAAGVYTEHDITLGKDLLVAGAVDGGTIVQAASDVLVAPGRVLAISPGVSVVLQDLDVRRGRAAEGGAIRNAGTLTLKRCVVEESRAIGGGPAGNGGGILSVGTLTLDRSIVRGNIAAAAGGGIHSSGATVIVASALEGNTATGNGGGLHAAAPAVLNDSTVSGNGAARGGGAFAAAVVTSNDSTISGNTAASDGGGIASQGAASALHSCTISQNTASGSGGGGASTSGGGTVSITNTILAGNTAPSAPSSADCTTGALSQGYNLVGTGTGCPSGATGDRTVSPSQVLGGVLTALSSNGGRTRTHALVTASPARDAGNPAGCFLDLDGSAGTAETASLADQRTFERPTDSDGNGTARCDIGAFESGPGFRPASDDFHAASLNPSLWTFENPLGDASVSVDGARARIAIPAGPTHDVWSGGINGARIVQSTANSDFEIEVKFESAVTVGNQIQGILVFQDANNLIRFDTFNADGVQTRIFAATFVAGSPTVRANANISAPGGAPFWLRIQRSGNTWTQRWSYDGVNFTTSATFTHAMTVNKVGPYAGNWKATLPAPAFTANIDYVLNTSQPGFSDDGSDAAAPALTSILASPSAPSSATISWTTNEPATTAVEIGPSQAAAVSTTTLQSLVTSHVVPLSGLGCGPIHYRVVSIDASGNTARSADATFTVSSCVDSDPPAIGEVAASPFEDKAAITWTTSEPATSLVQYGLTTVYGSSSPFDATLISCHSAILTGLACGQSYHFRVVSADAAANSASSSDATFAAAACPDSMPPVITNVAANAAAGTSATITWTTDEPATSRVAYGATTAYGQMTPLDQALVTSHSVGLTGLTCGGAVYHYSVLSADASSNAAGSPDATFTTGNCPPDTTPPEITQVMAAPGATTATITWTTDEPATSRVEYGLTTDYASALSSSQLVTSHSLGLTGLACGTMYHYRVVSADAHTNSAASSDMTFSTTACGGSPPISDDFHAGSLNTSLWSAVNPLGDASIGLNGTNLLISIPAGTAHDAWVGGNTTPRIVQVIPDVSFEVEAKFESAVMAAFQSQGILVEQGPDDYLRFDMFHDGGTPRIFAASLVAGTPTIRVNTALPNGGPPFWIRVTRSGDDWTEKWSTDGTSFTTAGAFTHVLSAAKVGVFAGNGSPAPAFISSCDYFFNTASPIDPEDGTSDTMPPQITNVAAAPNASGATITWTTDEPATSRVEYGATTSYGSMTPLDSTFVTSHSVPVGGLACNTTFHYRVLSADPSNNSSASQDGTFTTSLCPVGGPVSDDFFSGTLNTSLWTAVNPLGDATIGLDGTRLTIALPAGTAHDAWVGGNTTGRIMQTISDVSFEVVAKFESTVSSAFQSQGMIVEQDSDDYIRFDTFHDGGVPRIFAASLVANSPTIRFNTAVPAGAPFWLRVTRSGNDWTEAWSSDGVNFTTVGTFTHVLSVSAIGLFAGNAGSPPPAFTSSADYFFNTASPLDPEDGTLSFEAPRIRTNPGTP